MLNFVGKSKTSSMPSVPMDGERNNINTMSTIVYKRLGETGGEKKEAGRSHNIKVGPLRQVHIPVGALVILGLVVMRKHNRRQDLISSSHQLKQGRGCQFAQGAVLALHSVRLCPPRDGDHLNA
jgi:hypothetical protein